MPFHYRLFPLDTLSGTSIDELRQVQAEQAATYGHFELIKWILRKPGHVGNE